MSEDRLNQIYSARKRLQDLDSDFLLSRAHNFRNNLKAFVYFCETDPIMKELTSPLKNDQSVDLKKWWDDIFKNGSSMMGGKRYDLPASPDKQASLLYQFVLGIESGKFDFDTFCRSVYGYLIPDMHVSEFCNDITVKLTRFFDDKLEKSIQEATRIAPSRTKIFKLDIVPRYTLKFIETSLYSRKWTEAMRELARSEQAFEDGRTPDCCHNLRKALEIVWNNVYIELEGKEPPISQGSTQDIGPLVKVLRDRNIPEDSTKLVSRIWAYITERDHIEKRSGKAPSENETLYAFQLVFATIYYLLQLLP
jgi:HEPN domain-containing protein